MGFFFLSKNLLVSLCVFGRASLRRLINSHQSTPCKRDAHLCFHLKMNILKVHLRFARYFVQMHQLRQIRVQGSQYKEDCLYVDYNNGNDSLCGIFWEEKHTLNTAAVWAVTWMITVDGRNNNRLLKSRYFFKQQRSVSALSNSALSFCRV